MGTKRKSCTNHIHPEENQGRDFKLNYGTVIGPGEKTGRKDDKLVRMYNPVSHIGNSLPVYGMYSENLGRFVFYTE